MFNRIQIRRRKHPGSSNIKPAITRRFKETPFSRDYTDIDRRRDFNATFESTAHGRRVLQQLLDRCRVMDRCYVIGDTHETARREGARDIGLWLLEMVSERGQEKSVQAEAEQPDPASYA